MKTYEINLCCPVCGSYMFNWDGLEEIWLCHGCEWGGTTEEMIPNHYEVE
jgi:ribosomal protein L37AE/L43A